ncbi:unnamed protein product [Chondrus crispus]|uniref:Uncharacterized protein n=1 Tax=Chondrus crispus TaxID=2769 RepID=R7QKA9_CHOCR|nr:unnamed protein product [Chondrus crispus]CDF37916.1 unnamed protein product [Chondrus crispus]|eukprot:XP_005717788.1 unnamed protein product [Chondrus crispus]
MVLRISDKESEEANFASSHSKSVTYSMMSTPSTVGIAEEDTVRSRYCLRTRSTVDSRFFSSRVMASATEMRESRVPTRNSGSWRRWALQSPNLASRESLMEAKEDRPPSFGAETTHHLDVMICQGVGGMESTSP